MVKNKQNRQTVSDDFKIRGVAGTPARRGSEQAKVKLLNASEGKAFPS